MVGDALLVRWPKVPKPDPDTEGLAVQPPLQLQCELDMMALLINRPCG